MGEQVIQLKAPSSIYGEELLYMLWKDPGKDCIIYCEDGQLEVHQAVIASICPVIKECCQDYGEDMLGISIPGVSIQHISALVKLMYLGEAVAAVTDKTIVDGIARTVLMTSINLDNAQVDHDKEEDGGTSVNDQDDDELIDDPVLHEKCSRCLRTFETEDLLRNHVETCHDSLESNGLLDKNLNNHEYQSEDPFSMYLKPKRKHSKINLPEHANVNYQEAIKILVCGVCGISKDNFYPLMKRHYETSHYVKEEKTFYCPKASCNKKIASTNSFHSHIHIVHREAKYQCTQCAKKFKTSGSLNHHTARWHTIDRPIVCKQCGEGESYFEIVALFSHIFKGIASALHLEAHMRMHRSNHVCQVCNKKFLSASHLEKHKVTHTSDRPFMCGTCGKTFRDPYSVKECEMKHQGIRKLKPSQLIPWREREAKFVCDACGYRTKGKASLDRHIKGKHNREKPFTCKECGKDFKSRLILDAHLSVHAKCSDTNSSKPITESKGREESERFPEKQETLEVPSTNTQPFHLADASRASTAYFWMPHSNFTQSII